MKAVFLLLLSLPFYAGAQQLVLIDKQLKNPITVVQQVNGERLNGRLFPVYGTDLDSIMLVTNWFIQQLDDSRLAPSESTIKTVGQSRFIAQASSNGNVQYYTIQLITRTGNEGYVFELINNKDGHKKRVQKLRTFLDYLRNNQLLLAEKRN